MPWIGRKSLALIPLYRPNAHPPDQIPDDWNDQILRRVFFDPDPATGADRSLRTYIHTVSSGLADLDAAVMPMQTIDEQDVPPNALECYGAGDQCLARRVFHQCQRPGECVGHRAGRL